MNHLHVEVLPVHHLLLLQRLLGFLQRLLACSRLRLRPPRRLQLRSHPRQHPLLPIGLRLPSGCAAASILRLLLGGRRGRRCRSGGGGGGANRVAPLHQPALLLPLRRRPGARLHARGSCRLLLLLLLLPRRRLLPLLLALPPWLRLCSAWGPRLPEDWLLHQPLMQLLQHLQRVGCTAAQKGVGPSMPAASSLVRA